MTVHTSHAATSSMYRALVERASDLAMLAAADGTILYASPVVERLFGFTREQVQELTGLDFIHPADLPGRVVAWERLVASPLGTVEVGRFRVRDVSGGYRHVDQRATNLLDDPDLGAVAISLQDVTDRVAADEELVRSRRDLERLTTAQQRLLDRYRVAVEASGLGMWEYAAEREEERVRRERDHVAKVERFAAMGELAAGLTHDVSNLLTIVAGHADLLGMQLGEEHEDVAALVRAADRGRAMLQRVLSFAHPRTTSSDGTPAPAEAIRAFARSLPQLLGPAVHVDLVVDDATPAIPLDTTELDQVLLNLCVNAGAAMPDGGRLGIGCAPLPDHRRPTAPAGLPGDLVELVVADEGVGIDPDVLPRVFEPFVTTRRRDEGNGLGLAIVYRTITDAGGHVEIDSAPGAGTRVRVLLPCATAL